MSSKVEIVKGKTKVTKCTNKIQSHARNSLRRRTMDFLFLFCKSEPKKFVTSMCWQWTHITPKYIVRSVPNMIPPFLNASPIANTPDPMLPLRRCIRDSRYLQSFRVIAAIENKFEGVIKFWKRVWSDFLRFLLVLESFQKPRSAFELQRVFIMKDWNL